MQCAKRAAVAHAVLSELLVEAFLINSIEGWPGGEGCCRGKHAGPVVAQCSAGVQDPGAVLVWVFTGAGVDAKCSPVLFVGGGHADL